MWNLLFFMCLLWYNSRRPGDRVMESKKHLIKCWFCSAEFDIIDTSFCNHPSPSKICPFCLHCSCEAPESYQKYLWDNCPKQLLEEKLIKENRSNFRLGEILIRAGKITKNQLKEAIEKQRVLKKRLGEIIVMMDLVTPEELDLYLINQKQIEEVDLSRYKLEMGLIEKVGIDFCVLNKAVPIDEFVLDDLKVLYLAVGSEEDMGRLKLGERIAGYMVIPYKARPDELERVLNKIQGEDDSGEVLVLEDAQD